MALRHWYFYTNLPHSLCETFVHFVVKHQLRLPLPSKPLFTINIQTFLLNFQKVNLNPVNTLI